MCIRARTCMHIKQNRPIRVFFRETKMRGAICQAAVLNIQIHVVGRRSRDDIRSSSSLPLKSLAGSSFRLISAACWPLGALICVKLPDKQVLCGWVGHWALGDASISCAEIDLTKLLYGLWDAAHRNALLFMASSTMSGSWPLATISRRRSLYAFRIQNGPRLQVLYDQCLVHNKSGE